MDHDCSGNRINVGPYRTIALALPDLVGPARQAPPVGFQHSLYRRFRRERRSPHHNEGPLVGRRVLHQFEIDVNSEEQVVQHGQFVNLFLFPLRRFQPRMSEPVLGPSGEPSHQRVLRSEVMQW